MKLPNNLQLEQEILTSIFSSKNRIVLLLKISKEYFYNSISQNIYQEIVKDTGIDITVLNERLPKISVSKLVKWVGNEGFVGGDIESRLSLLKELYIKRELKKLAVNIEDSLKEDNVVKIITSIDRTLLRITKDTIIQSGKARDAYNQYLESKKDREIIKYGIDKLDSASNGHKKGQVWVLGGESGIGKSFFAMNVMIKNIMREKRVLFFSTELMSSMTFERAVKMFSAESGIEKGAAKYLSRNKNMLIYDSLRDPEEILLEIRRQKIIGGCDLAIIDHIQDIEVDSKSDRVKELETICNTLKDFAIQEKIAFFITSQLNDQGLFRDSRKIRHMATVALLLIGEKENGSYKDLKSIIIDKNRVGKVHGVVKVQMDEDCIFRQAKYE